MNEEAEKVSDDGPGLRALMPWLLRYARPYRALFFFLVLASVAEILVGLLAPWSLKILVDNVLGDQVQPGWLASLRGALSLDSKFSLLIAVCLAGLLIGVLGQVFSLIRTQLQITMGQRMVFDLQQELFDHLQKLSLRYHQEKGTGDAIYRLNSDSHCVSNVLMSGLFPLITSLITLILMFVILLRIEWSLALLSLIIIPPLFFIIHRYWTPLSKRTEKVKEMEGDIYNFVHEVFSSIKLVKAFSRETYEKSRFVGKGQSTVRKRLEITLHQSMFAFAVSALTFGGTAAVLAVGGWHALNGTLSVGELLVAVAYLAAVYAPLAAISHTVGSSQAATTSAARVFRTLQIQTERESAKTHILDHHTKLNGHIKFDNVSFSYPGVNEVLKNISFEVRPGEILAVVGLTGAGKSTLVSLIPRFYDATKGKVLIDGIDVCDIPLKSLRESISIVTQEPILFSSSIADNIRYGRLNATDDEVAAAARDAQAHDFIVRTQDGYDTLLGDAGGGLSGGERQRISIARALLKDSPILILDEPTSALDSRSESYIFEALHKLMAHRTTVVIAHRLSTIRNADKIIVLDNGRIADSGTHEQLLSTNALYRELCDRLMSQFQPTGADTEARSLRAA